MRKRRATLAVFTFLAFAFSLFMAAGPSLAEGPCNAVYGQGPHKFSLATGSPGELGLLEALAQSFNEVLPSTLCWVKAGSGKSLKLLHEKKVDCIMVHAPAAEKKAVEDGWAVGRTLIGSNEFYIVGPKADPAGIASAKTAAEAYGKIAKAGASFLSRGDNSGTHKKEMAIWAAAGIEPQGDWYVVTKDFMMATLKKADQIGGYFMTDSSTWVAGKKELGNLAVLFKGDPVLVNTYHGLSQPEGQGYASRFIEFVGSGKGQEVIRSYGKDLYGEAMYNDAQYATQYDH